MPRTRVIAVMAVTLAVSGCGGERGDQGNAPLTVSGVGFATPESVQHDAAGDVYLVSNINGSPLAKDDNGFISRLAPDGRVLELKWIDGAAPDATLHAPKGMAFKGDTLLVTDIDVVRLFHRITGAPLGEWAVAGATFLNGIAVGYDGTVYVTDSGFQAGEDGFAPSGTDAVHKFDAAGESVALVSGAALGGPNGIVVDGGRVMFVTLGSGRVHLVQRESGTISGLPAPPAGQLDGVVQVADGQFLISSWEGGAVYRLGAGGIYTTEVDSVEAPADIGFDAARRRVLIPLFWADEVWIRPVE
jgi:sugar lactone lactonase YvrE